MKTYVCGRNTKLHRKFEEGVFSMRNRFMAAFIIVVVAIFVSTPLLSAESTPQTANPQASAPHDISGIWRMLAPGQTRARAATVGAGGFHPTLGNGRAPLTAWGRMKGRQTPPAGRNNNTGQRD